MQPEGKRAGSVRTAAVAILIIVAGLALLGMMGVIGWSTASRGAATSAGMVSAQDTSGQIATGAGIFTEATMALIVGILFIGAFSLQIARNYFLRTLDKFTLRLGADIWWLAYIMIRDGLMFGALLVGFEMFFVGTYGDYAIAVPFMPLAIVLLAVVLVLKLVRDPDEEETTNRIVSTLTAAATFLYVFGVLMVTESIAGYGAAGYITNPNGSIATATGGSDVWTVIFNLFSSTVNPALATISFYVCFTALSILAAYAFFYVTRPSHKGKSRKAPASKVTAASPTTRDKVLQPVSGKTD